MPPTSWNTPTMAELHFQQGHLAQAVEIYRTVVAERPDDRAAAARLQELSTLLSTQTPGTKGAGKEVEPMGFREHMQRVADGVPGLISCTIMGFDGIAIDAIEPVPPPIDIPTFLAEYAAATNNFRRAAESQPVAGGVHDMVVRSDNVVTVLRPLTQDYFLAAVLHPQALAGKARFLLRMIAPGLISELG